MKKLKFNSKAVYMYMRLLLFDSNFPYLNILKWLWQVCSHQWLLKQEQAKFNYSCWKMKSYNKYIDNVILLIDLRYFVLSDWQY